MVTDNRSAGLTVPAEYAGYDALPIVDVKIHMLGQTRSGGHGLLRVITESGIEGWRNNLDVHAAHFIVDQFRDMLIGRDALARERIWHDLLMWERFQWSPKEVRGAIDIALWDITGKHLGLPVWRLLGACRDKVPAYRTQGGTLGPEGKTMKHFIDFAMQAKADGYKGCKDHCYGGVEFTIELAGELRDAVGPDFHLMHDAVQYYDLKEAIRVGRALEKHNYTWFEEPLRDHNFLGLKQLREALEISVVAGEYFPHQLHSYAQMLAMGAVDGIKPPIDIGLTEIMKLAHLTDAFGAQMHVQAHGHLWGFSSLHANGAIENMVMMEVHPPFEAYAHAAVGNPLQLSDGFVKMPEGPGFGVDLDWDIIENETSEVIG